MIRNATDGLEEPNKSQAPARNSELDRSYFVPLGAALIGAAAGALFFPTLWVGSQTLDTNKTPIMIVGGIFAGMFPGWFAALLTRFLAEKRSWDVSPRRLPALIAFLTAFVIAGAAACWYVSVGGTA
jgi:NhaP-type Na+/H+ or K+/H+ antiporter